MPRHWHVRQRLALPRFDLIESIKSVVIWTCGAIEFGIVFALIIGGVWLYTFK